MTKIENSDRNDQASTIEDAQLDIVVGGASNLPLSPQLAYLPVGGWTMRDIWSRPTLGTYH
jgi:hypothetical protein